MPEQVKPGYSENVFRLASSEKTFCVKNKQKNQQISNCLFALTMPLCIPLSAAYARPQLPAPCFTLEWQHESRGNRRLQVWPLGTPILLLADNRYADSQSVARVRPVVARWMPKQSVF